MRGRMMVAAMLAGSALGLAGCAQLTTEQPDLPHYWLNQALAAAKARDAPTALADIDKAQSLWEGSNIPFTNTMFDFDPDAMREMARARQSVQMGRWDDAEYYIRTAMTHPSTVTPP
jgi:hypothetical protein